MTRAMHAVRRGAPTEGDRSALRLAIARDGRIEREWVLEQGVVTFGRSDGADVAIDDPAHALTTLFRVDEDGITLHVPAGAVGRLQREAGADDLASRAGQVITLDATARGRVVLASGTQGAVSLLFQRVAPPVKRLRPELPASVRGGLLDRVDWLFTAVAAASFMLHLALVVGLSSADWPAPTLAITPREAEIYYSEASIPDVPDPTDPTQQSDDPSDPTDPTQPSDPTPSPTHTPDPHAPTHAHPTVAHADPTPSIDQVHASVDTAVEMVLGSSGLHSAIADLVRDGAPTQDSERILASVTGVDVATRSDVPTMHDGHSSGVPGDTFDLRTLATHGPRPEGGEPITEHAPRPVHVTMTGPDDPPDPGVFDDAMLRRALRARMPAIQQCYERELTRTPGLAGRIEVSMQVERAGVLSHVEASDDTVGSRGLADCVLNNVRTIRLADGPSEPIVVAYPMVFAPQQ